MKTQTNLLLDVVIIRNILIVLLVFYHAFAIFSGSWEPITGFPEIKVYWWLDKLSYSFMLEMFVLVSGYVFGYQVRTRGEWKLQAKDLFLGKFKRLYLPSIVLSLFYLLLYDDVTKPAYITAYDLLNGVGHMWFLPMLFWCFVGVWIIEKLKLNPKWAVLLLLVAAIGSFLPLPLRMSFAMFYLLFFYVGYAIQRYELSLDWLFTKRSAVLATLLFIILFPSLTLLYEQAGQVRDVFFGGNYYVTMVLKWSVKRVLQLICASAGILMTFSLIGTFLRKRNVAIVPNWMVQLSALSFGVYLFQQFILYGLYYYTNAPTIFGCYWLPWVGFVFTLISSLFLSGLLRKTTIGRFLIG